MPPTTTKCIIYVIIAIFLPPLTVFLMDGCKLPFWIDLILTILCFLPGLIYALYYMYTHPTDLI